MKNLVKHFKNHVQAQRNTKRTTKMLCDAATTSKGEGITVIVVGVNDRHKAELCRVAVGLFSESVLNNMLFTTKDSEAKTIAGLKSSDYEIFYDHFTLEDDLVKMLERYSKYEEN